MIFWQRKLVIQNNLEFWLLFSLVWISHLLGARNSLLEANGFGECLLCPQHNAYSTQGRSWFVILDSFVIWVNIGNCDPPNTNLHTFSFVLVTHFSPLWATVCRSQNSFANLITHCFCSSTRETQIILLSLLGNGGTESLGLESRSQDTMRAGATNRIQASWLPASNSRWAMEHTVCYGV